MLDIEYHQKLESYDPQTRRVSSSSSKTFVLRFRQTNLHFALTLPCAFSKSSPSLMNVVPLKSHCSSANLHTKTQILSLL